MAKIDKSLYTKEQWLKIKDQKRVEKELKRKNKENKTFDPLPKSLSVNSAFVLGNGTSRETIDLHQLSKIGKIYGCNALYRSFSPNYLIAVDVKMILEINKAGYQKNHEVWTNPNRSYEKMQGFNFFQPSKGWSSGPTALWLASQHRYENIYILGFDYRGLKDGTKFNNLYANTPNYKKSNEPATFFGNWLRQTKTVVHENPNINYIRVILPDNYCPEELNKYPNFRTIFVDQFKKIFNIM